MKASFVIGVFMVFALRKIDISEFRGIRKLSKPIELGSFNVLVGRNNVGKSAILEAVFLLSMPFRGETLSLYSKNVYDYLSGLHGGGKSLVYGHSGKAVINYEFTEGVKTFFERVKHDGEIVSGVDILVKNIEIEMDTVSFSKVVINRKYTMEDSLDYKNFLKSIGVACGSNILCLFVPNNSNSYERIASFVLDDKVFSWIEKHGFHRRVIRSILAPAIYDRFTEVTIRKDRLCVRKEVSEEIGSLYIDVDSLGEGVKRALLTYLVVEYLNPRIVLWDDIEVAAHPSLLETLLKWLVISGR